MAMTTYVVQIKTDEGHETNHTTASRKAAEDRGQDLAAAGYDGRIVTAKGKIVQEWTVEKQDN